MTVQERIKIVRTISKRIQDAGYLKLNQLSRVFDEEGIDRSVYASSGPKRWITENFPEFLIEGSNGRETIVLVKNVQRQIHVEEPLERIRILLEREISQKGPILLAKIPGLFEPNGIQYKEYAQGKKLQEWLRNTFPEFEISDDNLWLSWNSNLPEPVSESSLKELQKMHSVAFMNWWSANIKRLKALNEELSSENHVKAAVAHQFAKAMLGVPGALIDAREEENPRVAFKTGLQNRDGKEIYSILTINQKNVDGTKQKWILEDFSYPGENTPLGIWLGEHCSSENSGSLTIADLDKMAIEVKKTQEALIPLLESCLADMRTGRTACDRMSDRLAAYEEQCIELRKLYENVWGERYPLEVTLEQIIEQTSGRNAIEKKVRNAAMAFLDLIEEVKELFKLYRLPIQEDSSLDRDVEAIRKYTGEGDVTDLGVFERTIDIYRVLLKVMSSDVMTGEIEDQVDQCICVHFPEVSYRFAIRMLIGADESEWEFLKKIESIAEEVRDCKNIIHETLKKPDEDDVLDSSPENLLQLAMEPSEDTFVISSYAAAIYPKTKLEQMLVMADTEGILHQAPSMGENGLSYENLKGIMENTQFPTELTYFGAAQRLVQIVGTDSPLAEKYYLLGIANGEKDCIAALLELYRVTDRRDWFEKIAALFLHVVESSFENQIYYLSIMCDKEPDKAVEYADAHYYLYYIKESLQLLLSLPEGTLAPEKEQRLRARLEAFHGNEDENPLEKAIISGDCALIQKLAADRGFLAQNGYTDQEIDGIAVAAENNESEQDVSTDLYDIGVRLYKYQANHNGLAERYLWKGIVGDQQIRGIHILRLLVQEKRWDECCALYECFERTYSQNINCQRLYLISVVHCSAEKTEKYIRNNLQDSLAIMASTPNVKEVIEGAITAENSKMSRFLQEVTELCSFLEDPFVKSVILMDRTLREYSDPKKAGELGLPKEVADSIGGVYKSDDYSHGTDAISISERTFKFFGTYKGVAEAFAKFALPNTRALDQLWKIYNAVGDEQLQFELMQAFPQLEAAHKELFLKLLFQKERYAEYLSECDATEEDMGTQLQIFIARLKTNPETAGALPLQKDTDDSSRMLEWMRTWGVLLTSTLAENDRLSDIEAIFFTFFKEWLLHYAPDLIHDIVTAKAALKSDDFRHIQESALAGGQIEIAVYLFNILHVGQIQQESDKFFDIQKEGIENLNDEGQLAVWQKLKIIYGENLKEVDYRIAILKIQIIRKKEAPLSNQEAREIGGIIQELPTDGQVMADFLEALKDTSLCYNYYIYTSLAQLANKSGNERELVFFFEKMANMPEAKRNSSFLGFVCRFCVDTFIAGKFPLEARKSILDMCMNLLQGSKTIDTMLCVYFVERSLNQDHLADYLLRIFSEQTIDSTGEKLGEIISNEIRKIWGSELPNYFDLFRAVLDRLQLEEIEEYVRFASLCSGDGFTNALPIQTAMVDYENKIMSESDSNDILKQLFANPKESANWKLCTRLPLDDNPAAYAKLKIIASGYNPELWRQCVEYCTKYELNELLLISIHGWLEHGTANGVSDCRKFLEKKLTDNPQFFSQWRYEPTLLEVSKLVCKRTKETENDHHASLRAISLIAVKTGIPEAFNYLLSQYGDLLFGDSCNLGFAITAQLMFDGRFEEAHKVLGMLVQAIGHMYYKDLVTTLSGLDILELEQWFREPENEIMLSLVLPDGNRPRLESINLITYNGIMDGRIKETANVLSQILKMFPDDYCVYNALFDLCCTQFDGYIEILHMCLRGLVRLQPSNTAKFFYRRSQNQYANMLAVLDAVLIMKNRTNMIQDYDFSVATGDYFKRVGGAHITFEDAAGVSEVRSGILLSFKNRSEEEVEKISAGYLSCLTGNWEGFLKNAWKERRDITQELNKDIAGVENLGFTRSFLRTLLGIENAERSDFISWVQSMVNPTNAAQRSTKAKQVQFVRSFYENGYFDKLEKQELPEMLGTLGKLLINPLEDYSFCTFFINYISSAVKENFEHTFELSFLLDSLVCHIGFQDELTKTASMLFDEGNDKLASALYLALYRTNRLFNLVSRNDKSYKGNEYSYMNELYETRYRITALFQNSKEMVEKVSDPKFHVWSCINMVLTLLYSQRADEIDRLTSYLAPQNARVAESIVRAFDSTISNREKLNLINGISGDVEKAYFCFVLKYPYNPYRKNKPINYAIALTDRTVMEEVNTQYVTLAKMLAEREDGSFRGALPVHTLLVDSTKVDTSKIKQKDPLLWKQEDNLMLLSSEDKTIEPPFFVEGIEAINETVDMDGLITEHNNIQSFVKNFQMRYELSKRIYQCSIGKSYAEIDSFEAMLLMGVDYYYLLLSSGDSETANRTVLAMARLLKLKQSTGLGSDALKSLIRNKGLFELLNSPNTLEELLALYMENRSNFHFMRGLMTDSLLMSCVGQIYSVLDRLKTASSFLSNDTADVRKELSEGYRQLERIETNRWMDLKNKVQKLINDEINELDRRPVLQIQVLNQGVQRNYGHLYGQICNIGQATAEKVILQASYNNDSHSRQYVLERLAPSAKAVFELDYDTAVGTESMEYYLNTSFAYGDKTYSFIAAKGLLEFGEIGEPDYPTGILCRDPNGIMFSVNRETGNVYSPDFFGRKKETAELRMLVEGNDFAFYRSALVYGIRRTGKTSLLNYLETYIQANRPNIICVKADCQNMPATNCVQYIFIDHVIEHVERQVPGLKGSDSWDALKDEWHSPNFCADRYPEKLSLFYTDIKPLLGEQGIYLIIDEIDRLFERIEEGQVANNRNLDSLFGAISAMLNSSECKQAVHFVICGSNWLIRYNLKGDRKNQLFQRFGKQIIEVGKLPETDARDVICMPYRNYPELVISEEAIDWIWDYIGGLVWHTKLLAEEAIRRAKGDSRRVVYPSDVQQCLPKVLNDQWCKQFYEGCESGAEHKIVDVMQSLASKRELYVHIARISELLHWEIIEVERTMAILKALKVVEQHPIDHQLYRFEQDIYRRYFRTTPSELKRIPEEPDVFQDKQQLASVENASNMKVTINTEADDSAKNDFDELY